MNERIIKCGPSAQRDTTPLGKRKEVPASAARCTGLEAMCLLKSASKQRQTLCECIQRRPPLQSNPQGQRAEAESQGLGEGEGEAACNGDGDFVPSDENISGTDGDGYTTL